MLEKRMLKNSGVEVSGLCMGLLTMSPLQTGMSDEQGGELILCAMRQGISFFDTAQMYRNYGQIRYALAKAHASSELPEPVIASKTYAFDKKGAAEAVEEARSAIDRDYIDIFLLHEQESENTVRGHMEALEYLNECKARGIIRAVGLSTHFVAGVRGALRYSYLIDVVHPLINRAGIGIADGTRADMESALKDAGSAGIGIYAMKALGGGNLYHDVKNSFDYILSLPYVDSVAVGMQTEDEIEKNVSYFSGGPFSHTLERKRRLQIDYWCEGCGRCAARCKNSALHIENGKAVCDTSKCVLCGYCSGACPQMAIKII